MTSPNSSITSTGSKSLTLNQSILNEPITELENQLQCIEERDGWLPITNKIMKLARDAILKDKPEHLRLLIKNGVSPDAMVQNPGENSKLYHLKHIAAKSGSLPLVEILFNESSSKKHTISEKQDHYDANTRSLETAVQCGHADIVKFLLDQGINANRNHIYYPNKPILFTATKNQNNKIINILCKYGASISKTLYEITIYFDEQDSQARMLSQDICNEDRRTSLRFLLDNASGYNFKEILYYSSFGLPPKIPFSKVFQKVDVSNFNFIGVSYCGNPITRELLSSWGIVGADNALTKLSHLDNLIDTERVEHLRTNLVKLIEELGETPNSDEILNLLSLENATKYELEETIQIRLNHGIDPNGKTNKQAPIVTAASTGNVVIVKFFSEHPQINKIDFFEAFYLAERNNFLEVSEHLKSKISPNDRDLSGETLIHFYCRKGNLDEISRLTNKGADLSILDEEDSLIWVTLTTFAKSRAKEKRSKLFDILKFLIDNGVKFNSDNFIQYLEKAIKSKSFKLFKLIASSIPKNALENYEKRKQHHWSSQLLLESYQREHKQKIKLLNYLLDRGADINFKTALGSTLLQQFILDFPTTLDILNDINELSNSLRGYDKKIAQSHLKNAYKHFKSRQKNSIESYLIELLLLLKHQADPNIRYQIYNYKSKSILQVFIERKISETLTDASRFVLESLISHGANINSKDDNETTPLHSAVKTHNIELVKFLLEKGADPTLKNSNNETPIELAKSIKSPVFDLLNNL